MALPDDVTLREVSFDELESVDQFEATFSGTLHGEQITLTYTLETAVVNDEEGTVYTPGDDELEQLDVRPETYEFEADDRDMVRFVASDDGGKDHAMVYVFAEAEDTDENRVGLEVDPDS